MNHTIVNLSNWPVSIRLNTGATRHISPHGSISGIPSGEISGNARIEKLLRRRLIAVREATPPRSRDLSASQAIEHIRRTPIVDLEDFVAAGEDRVTVLRAFEEKRALEEQKSS